MSLRVLMVDDDEMTRNVLGRALRSMGHAVDVCDGADSALLCLREGTYDVLLTDLVMPGMDGLELSRRAREARTELRCLLMSGHAPRGEEQEGVVWLTKPIDLDRLLDAIAG